MGLFCQKKISATLKKRSTPDDDSKILVHGVHFIGHVRWCEITCTKPLSKLNETSFTLGETLRYCVSKYPTASCGRCHFFYLLYMGVPHSGQTIPWSGFLPFKVTSKMQLTSFPDGSVNVYLTRVVCRVNSDPGTWLSDTETDPLLSVALAGNQLMVFETCPGAASSSISLGQ